tara:strand:- start:6788 stop:7036 length:249 start_codon:yes stop_codon:yes gene_type:complete
MNLTQEECEVFLKLLKMRCKYWQRRYDQSFESRDDKLDWLIQLNTDEEHDANNRRWRAEAEKYLSKYKPIIAKLDPPTHTPD